MFKELFERITALFIATTFLIAINRNQELRAKEIYTHYYYFDTDFGGLTFRST